MSWSSAFDDPIPLPRGRHLVTRKDAEAVPGPHLVYGFLTTALNAVVEPIHPKAMPVILTTNEERAVG
jgi:putative SOS response-associated peptidase YedK